MVWLTVPSSSKTMGSKRGKFAVNWVRMITRKLLSKWLVHDSFTTTRGRWTSPSPPTTRTRTKRKSQSSSRWFLQRITVIVENCVVNLYAWNWAVIMLSSLPECSDMSISQGKTKRCSSLRSHSCIPGTKYDTATKHILWWMVDKTLLFVFCSWFILWRGNKLWLQRLWFRVRRAKVWWLRATREWRQRSPCVAVRVCRHLHCDPRVGHSAHVLGLLLCSKVWDETPASKPSWPLGPLPGSPRVSHGIVGVQFNSYNFILYDPK